MAPARTRRIIDEAGAAAVLDAAKQLAVANGNRVVMAVVDPWGELVAFRRTKDAQTASSRVALDKARTAAIYRRPSKDFEDQASHGRPSALHLARAVPLQGGEPIIVGDHVIGAVGVSGATSADEDRELALIGAGSVSANGDGAAFVSAADRREVDA